MKMYMNIVLFVLFHFEMLYAQQSYTFNYTYSVDTAITTVVSVECVANTYWVVGSVVPIGSDHGKIYLQKLSNTGGSEATFLIDTGFAYRTISLGGSMQKDYNNDLVVVFTKGETEFTRDYVLLKTKSTGDIVFKKQYNRSGNQNFSQVVLCADGGYFIVGTSQQFYSPTNFEPARTYVIKTDSNGAVEWENIYPANNVAPLYASQTPDGGYIISGYQYNTATGYDMYALKITAQGSISWEKTYGTPVDDGGCNVQSYPLGGYYLNGLKWGGGVTKQLYSAWLDDAGNTIYSNTITKNERYGQACAPIFYSDGSYKMVTLSYGPPPIWEVAFTTFNNSGEIVSEVPISSGLPGEDYIRDLEPTPDGGYILAGFRYIGYPERSWVVKLGPNGEYCGTAPCLDSLFVSSITVPPRFEGGQGGEQPAAVYPNPLPAGSSTVQIRYSLPPQLPFGVWELYNLQGQKVRYQVLAAPGSSPSSPLKGEQIQSLDLSGIPSGMYVWRLALPGGYEQHEASGKLIVQ